MWIAVGAVVLVVLGVVVAKRTWRTDADEVRSVRSYQHALGTMEYLSGQNGRPTARAGGAVAAPAAGLRNELPSAAEGPLVFDDADPTGRMRQAAGSGSTEVPSTDRARQQALHSMNRRPRRLAATTLVVAVVLVFGALAVVGSRHHNHLRSATIRQRSSHVTGSHVTSGSSHVTTVTTVPHHQGGSTKGNRKKSTPTTTTTTPTQLIATNSSVATATYTVPATYAVTITTTANCWVGATNRLTGATVWTGTLAPGASHTITAPGPMSVELGASGASLRVNRTPVVLPTTIRAPFTAVFAPATATTAPSS